MKHITEIFDATLKRHICRTEEVIFERLLEDSQMKKLYEGLSNGAIQTDEDARKYVYNATCDSSKFRMLKKRLLERVYSAILLIQPKTIQNSPYLKAEYFCHKNLIVARLLYHTGARKASIKLMKKVLQMAGESNQFEIALLAATKLRQASTYDGDPKSFNRYRNLCKEYHNTIRAEHFVEEKYHEFIIQFTKSRAKKTHLLPSLNRLSSKAEGLRKKYDTYWVNLYCFRLKVLEYEISSQNNQLLKHATAYEHWLLANDIFYSPVRHGNIIVYKVEAYLKLSKYEECLSEINRSLQLLPTLIETWGEVRDYQFLLLLQNERLNEAGSVLKAVAESKNFKDMRPQRHESWKIYSGYFWLMLMYHDRKDLLEKYYPEKNFRLTSLFNSIPIYSKDKQGLYVSLLVLQILYLMLNKDYTAVYDRIEPLKTYLYRRLRTKEDHRMRSFIKLVLAFIYVDFDIKRVRAKADEFHKEVKNYPAFNNSDLQLEVIPYEKQWALMKHLSKNKPRKLIRKFA